ncbi:MAG: glucosamine-6-phosphate deaminase, partial [Eubacteriales bacterium]|nr:glucosamine-6-phosphate deaminase [Eubacteriales bacterium]
MILKQGKIDSLEYRVYDHRGNMGLAAAKDAAFVIKKLLGEKNEISVIFAAAPSQNDFLECLVADKTIDFRRINGFHMDEYVGLDPKAPQAFGQFLRDRLFEK